MSVMQNGSLSGSSMSSMNMHCIGRPW